jgi:hypothetical protein
MIVADFRDDRVHSMGVCNKYIAFVKWVARYMFERDPVGEIHKYIVYRAE